MTRAKRPPREGKAKARSAARRAARQGGERKPTPETVLRLRLGDLMSRPVVTAKPSETLRAVAKRMNLHAIGCVVVVDQGRVVGVVTERDLLRCTAKGVPPDKAAAESAMTKPVITAGPEDEIPEAIRLLVLHNIKKLPVLDDGRLVGIVTFSDFAQLAPAYSDFFAKARGEADRRARERFEKYVHGPADPWTFV